MTASRLRAVPCTRYISRFFETTLVYLYSLASATTLSRRENSEGRKFRASNARKILWHRIRTTRTRSKRTFFERASSTMHFSREYDVAALCSTRWALITNTYSNTYIYNNRVLGQVWIIWNFRISINVERLNNSKLISSSLLNWTYAKKNVFKLVNSN